MVNERQGKVYNPRPVYNRKLLRSVIRAGVQKKLKIIIKESEV